MKKIIKANIEILDGYYRVKQGKIQEGDYVYSEGNYDYDYIHWMLVDEDYKILKDCVINEIYMRKDLECMHGFTENDIPEIFMSLEALDRLKAMDNELPIELEDRLKEIIKTEKYDIIRDGEKEAVNCVGDLENEYSSGCCRCRRGYSCCDEPNEMGV